MGGSKPVDWLDDLGASFEAAVVREEDVAAADLAFSLRQDRDLPTALQGRGWVALLEGGASAAVAEMGEDYVVAGPHVVPISKAFLRSAERPAPDRRERTFSEWLSSACRAGSAIEVVAGGHRTAGRLTAVGRRHLVLRRQGRDSVVGLDSIDCVTVAAGDAAIRPRGG